MKNFILTVSTAVILSLGATAMAMPGGSDDATIGIVDSNILQDQGGHELDQMAVIGLVNDDFGGDARIAVVRSGILQFQRGHHNSQEAQMGIVGEAGGRN